MHCLGDVDATKAEEGLFGEIELGFEAPSRAHMLQHVQDFPIPAVLLVPCPEKTVTVTDVDEGKVGIWGSITQIGCRGTRSQQNPGRRKCLRAAYRKSVSKNLES